VDYDKLILVKSPTGCILALTLNEYFAASNRAKYLERQGRLIEHMKKPEAKEAS
jgi:hypothetical protein